MLIDVDDQLGLPRPLWLDRTNNATDISDAMRTVNKYMPIPDFDVQAAEKPSTTVISAFFPPPPGEHLMRYSPTGAAPRPLLDYIEGLKIMATTSEYLVVFVPPGEYAEAIRAINALNVVVLDHYESVWDIPHLQGKREEFYGRQVELLDSAYRPGKHRYGEPHSWAGWNIKSFLILEALKLDPFRTSHFAWVDARVPTLKGVEFKEDAVHWPNPLAVQNVFDTMPLSDRAIVFTLEFALAAPGTPYWPVVLEDGTRRDAYMSDILSLYGGLFFGNKESLARLSRALLVLVERDIARGYYVGREEFQLSYSHFEFRNLVAVAEIFRLTGIKPSALYAQPYNLFSDPNTNLTDLGLDREPTLRPYAAPLGPIAPTLDVNPPSSKIGTIFALVGALVLSLLLFQLPRSRRLNKPRVRKGRVFQWM